MDEEITIINEKTRNEKIKSFFLENKKALLSLITILIFLIFSFYIYQIYQDKNKEKISDKYNNTVINYNNNNDKFKTVSSMKEVIEAQNSTYSPLALYFLIDNNLIENKVEVNELFDVLIEKTSLEKEIKNLIIYKKALYNADDAKENELLDILKPLVNSESMWKSHALYLLAEFFYFKGDKKKSAEFFNEIIIIENANQDILKETKKRLNRDLSE